MKTTLPGVVSNFGRYSKLVFAIVLSITLSTAYAAEQKYNDSWGKQGLSLTRQGTEGLNLNFSIQHFSFSDRDVNGEIMTAIEFSESFLPNEAGAPDLPGFGRYIAIPNGATPIVEIVSMRKEKFSNIEIAPAPRIPLDTDQSPLYYSKNNQIYTKNAFYPAEPVSLGLVASYMPQSPLSST